MADHLEIRVSKWRTLGLLVITCVMVAGSYFLTTVPDFEHKIVAWIGVCFFSLGLIVLPRQLLTVGPVVIINEHGFEDRRTRLGVIPWPDIKGMSVCEINKQRILCVDVHDLEKYEARLATVGKHTVKLNKALGFSEISIGFSGLTHSADQALEFIQERQWVAE